MNGGCDTVSREREGKGKSCAPGLPSIAKPLKSPDLFGYRQVS
jgi:hypothetical protein